MLQHELKGDAQRLHHLRPTTAIPSVIDTSTSGPLPADVLRVVNRVGAGNPTNTRLVEYAYDQTRHRDPAFVRRRRSSPTTIQRTPQLTQEKPHKAGIINPIATSTPSDHVQLQTTTTSTRSVFSSNSRILEWCARVPLPPPPKLSNSTHNSFHSGV